MASLTGCSTTRQPPLSAPPPIGTNIRAIQQKQIDGATADRFTIYRHEWANDGDTLGDYGNQHLEEIAGLVVETNRSVLIEVGVDVRLNESRREFLVHYLAERQIPDPRRRVIVGRPAAHGIPGDEAIEIYQARPIPSSTGGGDRGSSGGSNGRSSASGF